MLCPKSKSSSGFREGHCKRAKPKTLLYTARSTARFDGAANVALNIAALGAGVSLSGLVGRDEAADALVETMAAANVHSELHSVDTQPTITKLRVMSRHQQLLRMDFEETFSPEDAQVLVQKSQQLLGSVGALILSDYAKGALADPALLIAAAKKAAQN